MAGRPLLFCPTCPTRAAGPSECLPFTPNDVPLRSTSSLQPMDAPTTLSPAAEHLQQLGYMADDEPSIRRVLRYVKRVNNQRTTDIATRETISQQELTSLLDTMKS